MISTFRLLPKLALIAGLALSLGFGASEAVACAACVQPDDPCKDEADPALFCHNLCVQNDCVTGDCITALDKCECVE